MAFPILGNPKPQFFDSSGSPLSSGTVSVLDPADDTNKASYPTYDDAEAATNANSNPLTLDSRGEPSSGLWGLDNEDYKIVLKDSSGSTVYTIDDIYTPGVTQAGVGKLLYPQTTAETTASVTPTNYQYPEFDVRRYGAAVDGSTDDHTAVTNAISVAIAAGGAEVLFPPGTCRIESDLELRDFVRLRGQGNGTLLEFNGCALQLDAVAAADPDISSRHLTEWAIDNIRISRIGTAGYAVECVTTGGTGASDNNDVIRFDVRGLHIVSSTGGGLSINGMYIGSFFNTFIRACSGTGLLINEQSGTLNTSLQAAAFFGGETQNCTKAAEIDRARGLAFYSVTIQGNDEGVDINFGVNYTFDNCWFESNAQYDIKVGEDSSGGPDCFTVRGCRMTAPTTATDYAIDLIRCNSALIENCTFEDYNNAGVNRNGAASTSVTGVMRRCEGLSGLTLLDNGNQYFHVDPEESVLVGSVAWDPASISDGDQDETDITVTGAAVGDFVLVSSTGALSDLSLTGYVRAADTVRVILQNNTGGAVDLSSRTFRAVVIPNVWF